MDPIKIIFFDIDGTLVDMNRKCISEKTVEALRRLRERGILLCIATGRSPVSLPKFEGVEFDAFLTFNGSYCFCKEGDIFSNPIPYADVMTLLRNAAGLGRPVALATKEKLTANGWEEDLAQYLVLDMLRLKISAVVSQLQHLRLPLHLKSKQRESSTVKLLYRTLILQLVQDHMEKVDVLTLRHIMQCN